MNTRHPGRPKKCNWPSCKIKDCLRSTKGGAKGFCHSHYVSMRRGYLRVDGTWATSTGRRHPILKGQTCLVSGCSALVRTRGMCNRHYLQLRSGMINDKGLTLRAPLPRGRPRKERWVGREGYVLVQAPVGHPCARQDGSILEHRLVMETQLGRTLKEWEVVHHKDGNRQNNAPKNLELLDGRSRRSTEGHPPAHEFDVATAVQVLLQQDRLPRRLRVELMALKAR